MSMRRRPPGGSKKEAAAKEKSSFVSPSSPLSEDRRRRKGGGMGGVVDSGGDGLARSSPLPPNEELGGGQNKARTRRCGCRMPQGEGEGKRWHLWKHTSSPTVSWFLASYLPDSLQLFGECNKILGKWPSSYCSLVFFPSKGEFWALPSIAFSVFARGRRRKVVERGEKR